MNNKQGDPLLEWNRLNIENAEQDLVSAMFSSMISTSPIVDRFSVWLLAGTGATAALMIGNLQNIIPFLTVFGFKVCGSFLITSGIFGFFAKHKAIACQIAYENDLKIRQAMPPVLDKHFHNEGKIVEYAEKRGMQINTKIDMRHVLEEFAKPFPRLARWLLNRHFKNLKQHRQLGYHKPVKAYYQQCCYTVWQAVSFMAFVIAGIVYANVAIR